MAGQRGSFDQEERLRALSAAGDTLERLAAAVDFELFRPELDAALERSDRSKDGRPPYDAVLMFKVLVLHPGPPTRGRSGAYSWSAAPEKMPSNPFAGSLKPSNSVCSSTCSNLPLGSLRRIFRLDLRGLFGVSL